MPRKEEYLDIETSQEELGVSRQTIYSLIARGVLRRFKKVGSKRVYIPAEDIEKLKANKYEEA